MLIMLSDLEFPGYWGKSLGWETLKLRINLNIFPQSTELINYWAQHFSPKLQIIRDLYCLLTWALLWKKYCCKNYAKTFFLPIMNQFCSQLDQEEKRAESLDYFNVLDNFRAMEGGSTYSYICQAQFSPSCNPSFHLQPSQLSFSLILHFISSLWQ